ncbi:helix-turn-helix domain-containing protein [Pedobacter lithocola]|uniref:Helix-turn-helix domain-containing protein n=1 Tax=Pedobacter lithocola TaxID=1908239 RepID=A0ABV8P3E7_9SPHI
MVKHQTLGEYSSSLPESVKTDHRIGGHFVAIRLDEFSAENIEASRIYSRKDFYKITLATGHATFHSKNKEYHIRPDECALIFTNREIPYRWDVHTENCSGYSCMFTEDFLPPHCFLRKSDCTIFDSNSRSVFPLNKSQKDFFSNLFLKMLSEQESSYSYKYDLLFLYVLECIHAAMKMEPDLGSTGRNASNRLNESFKALMASQFPIVNPSQQIELRTAQAFAERLAVHTNHLNRSLKAVTGYTTKKLIMDRIMQEANALLLYSDWTISQISYSLGFDQPTHFTQAFKLSTGKTPSYIRKNI